MNNKIILTISILALILSGAGLVRSSTSTQSTPVVQSPLALTTLEEIKQNKKMTVCYGASNPTSYKDSATGEVKGHDIDILKEMFGSLNVKTEYLEQSFGNFAAALDSNKCNVAVSYLILPERAANLSYSNPVFYIGLGGLTKSEGGKTFNSVAEIDQPGIRVATALGEAGDVWAKKNLKKATVNAIDVGNNDTSRFMLEVSSGRADIAIADSNAVGLYAKSHSDTVDAFAGKSFNVSAVGYAFKSSPQNQTLKDFVNTSLSSMEQSGRVTEIMDGYKAQFLRERKQFR
jgi:cyclohexadienyl dehydratase